jgi:hypothetical protein
MSKYLFLYRNTTESYANLPPDERQRMLQKWQTWITDGMRQGWMLDGGDGLKVEGRVVNARQVVTDGPFVELKEVVGGYSIIRADSLDAAAELAKGCPIFLRGGSVEVRQLQEFNVGK